MGVEGWGGEWGVGRGRKRFQRGGVGGMGRRMGDWKGLVPKRFPRLRSLEEIIKWFQRGWAEGWGAEGGRQDGRGGGRGCDDIRLSSLKNEKSIDLNRQEGRECRRQVGELDIRGQIKGK